MTTGLYRFSRNPMYVAVTRDADGMGHEFCVGRTRPICRVRHRRIPPASGIRGRTLARAHSRRTSGTSTRRACPAGCCERANPLGFGHTPAIAGARGIPNVEEYIPGSLAGLGAFIALASLPSQADTLRNGFSVERLSRVDAVLDSYVNDGRVAGIVALVLRDGKPVYQHAVGWADKEAGRKMTMDTEFRIASQTKALTSVAILQLMEEGKLTVNDRAGKWIPTFEKTQVSTQERERRRHQPWWRPSVRSTSRTCSRTPPAFPTAPSPRSPQPTRPRAWGRPPVTAITLPTRTNPSATSMERLGTLPFVAQPGDRWVYGYNTDILGCIVEKASGVSLDEFIRTHITGPLGMKDTYFFLPPEKRERFAAVYGSDADGKAVRQPEGQKGQGHYVDGPRKSFSGGAGLVSTAHDYATFLEALRNGGALGKVRILSPHAVQLMTTNQVGKLRGETANRLRLRIRDPRPYGNSGMESVGSWGWGGAYGTYYRVDPEERLVTVMMIQLLPNSTDLKDKFTASIYQALLELNFGRNMPVRSR